jgi:hypothetical protein
VTDKIVKWISGIEKSDEGMNNITLIGLCTAAVAAGIIIIGLLYALAKRFPKVMSLYESLRDKIIFGAILTFYLKSYLKLFTNSFTSFMDESQPETSRLIPYVILLVLAVSPPILFVGLWVAPTSSPKFQQLFGSLVLNLSLNSKSSQLFNFFFIFRRFIYGISISLMSSWPGIQISL